MVIDAAVDYLPSPLEVSGGHIEVSDVDDDDKKEEIAVSDSSPL